MCAINWPRPYVSDGTNDEGYHGVNDGLDGPLYRADGRDGCCGIRKKKVAVVGVGNLLLKDEGIGVHVARELEKVSSPANIELEVIDGGTSSNLEVGEVDKLIIVDAAMMGGKAGDIYRLSPEDVNLSSHPHAHEVSLLYELELKRILKLPHPRKIIMFGIEPKDIGWGLDLSEELKQKIPQVLSLVREELEKT